MAYADTACPGNQEELCNQIRLTETMHVLTNKGFTRSLF